MGAEQGGSDTISRDNSSVSQVSRKESERNQNSVKRDNNRNKKSPDEKQIKSKSQSEPQEIKKKGKNSGKVNNRSKQRTKNTSNENPFKEPINDKTEKFQQLRQDQINQCLHVLGNDNFKLFRNGRYVTTYAIKINEKKFNKFFDKDEGIKFAINIPYDYPRTSLKLSSNKSNSQESSENNMLNFLIKNYNSKAKQMSVENISIISQLNYLSEEIGILVEKDFRTIDKMRQKLYLQFIEQVI